MSRKVILYIATSLDGYIADKNGSIDFLSENSGESQDDCGYGKLLHDVDTIIMGSKTYLQIVNELAVDEWPYQGKKTYVYTSQNLPEDPNVEFKNGDVAELIQTLKWYEGKGIWICGGADIIKQLMQENLIEEYQIYTVPVVLGKGTKLFQNENKVKLSLVKTTKHGQISGSIYKKKN